LSASRDDDDARLENEPDAGAPDPPSLEPPREKPSTTRSSETNRKNDPDADGVDPENERNPEKRAFMEFLTLLVVTGGFTGTLAVVLGYFTGIDAFALIHPDYESTIHGFAFAAPVAFLDASLMLPRWDVDARPDPFPQTRIEALRVALARAQREETLSNPCRSMPLARDFAVAAVSRLADEMLERAVLVGFLSSWIADRAVETGLEPYEATDPAKYIAIALLYAYLEVRLRRDAARDRQRIRAFRVDTDPATGKQTIRPMRETELNESAARASKGPGMNDVKPTLAETTNENASGIEAVRSDASSAGDSVEGVPEIPAALAADAATSNPIGSVLFTRSVRRFLDGARSRASFVAQCLCFATAADSNLWAPIVGGLTCDALFIAYQRLGMKRFFEAAGVELPVGRPPTNEEIEKTRAVSLRRDLGRRRRSMDALDRESFEGNALEGVASEASGAKEVNILMREVVGEVRRGFALEKESDALTFVLRRVEKELGDDSMDVRKRRAVLLEIRKETQAGNVEVVRDVAPSERALSVDDARDSNSSPAAAESARDGEEETSPDETPFQTAAATSEKKTLGASVGSRADASTDLASLARSNETAHPESIWEAARRETRAERAKEKEMEKGAKLESLNEDLAPAEPLRGVNSTWDALDRLTAAVEAKLRNEDDVDATGA
jgi:hypothetical protein